MWNDETWTFEGESYDYGSTDTGGSSSIDWGEVAGGVGNTLNGLANIYANTWSQQTLMQQAQNGQRFVEGQRMQQTGQILGGISPLILLLGAGLVFALAIRG